MEAADPPSGRTDGRAGVKIGAIVLAAGSSSRLGRPKQLLKHEGQTLVRRTAQAALEAGCRPVVVVLGSGRERIETELAGLAIEIVRNDQWQRGIGTSIRAGVDALKDCDALIILACDQPHVDARVIRQLVARHQETKKPMVASAYAGTLGVPALFARVYFDQLLSLGDEQGAKALLNAGLGDVAKVDFPEGAVDIDTPDDFRALSA